MRYIFKNNEDAYRAVETCWRKRDGSVSIDGREVDDSFKCGAASKAFMAIASE